MFLLGNKVSVLYTSSFVLCFLHSFDAFFNRGESQSVQLMKMKHYPSRKGRGQMGFFPSPISDSMNEEAMK